MRVNVVCFVVNGHIHGLAKADGTVGVPVDPWCTGGHCGHARTRVWSSGAARVGLEAVGVAARPPKSANISQYFVKSQWNQWKAMIINENYENLLKSSVSNDFPWHRITELSRSRPSGDTYAAPDVQTHAHSVARCLRTRPGDRRHAYSDPYPREIDNIDICHETHSISWFYYHQIKA